MNRKSPQTTFAATTGNVAVPEVIAKYTNGKDLVLKS